MPNPADFYPRPPRGGRPVNWHFSVPVLCISIHALREEGDTASRPTEAPTGQFLSTPSARRATVIRLFSSARSNNFYPRPPRGGRPRRRRSPRPAARISIHALREEGDAASANGGAVGTQFLSTPSARRATAPDRWNMAATWYFYPRPPRGGRHCTFFSTWAATSGDFYPRPPRGGRLSSAPRAARRRYFYPRPPRGGRRSHKVTSPPPNVFLSTPSARRATVAFWTVVVVRGFLSTPSARRATSDKGISRIDEKFLSTPSARRATAQPSKNGNSQGYFYPRPPRGGRPPRSAPATLRTVFLSTPSARRATPLLDTISNNSRAISIHALREEGDRCSPMIATRGGISIHALREEGDSWSCGVC